jgi:thioredoxin-related protein
MKKNNFILLILICNTIVAQNSYNNGNLESELISEKVNTEYIGITLDNDSITIGEKIILLSFAYFACRPCMLEIPYLNKLYDKYQQEIEIVVVLPHVASDIIIYQENIDTTSLFCRIRRRSGFEKIRYSIIPECKVKKNKSKNRIGCECNNIRKNFGVLNFPTILLLDEEGTIRNTYSDFASNEAESIINQIEADIDLLLLGQSMLK